MNRISLTTAALTACCAVAQAGTWRGSEPPDPRDASVAAQAFVMRRAAELGLGAGTETEVVSRKEAPSGTYIRLERRQLGLRVVGGEIVVHRDRAGRIDLASARELPAVDVGLQPVLDADAAEAIARAATGTGPAAHAERREPVLAASQGALRLAWDVFLFSDDPVSRWRVLVDDATGQVLQAGDMVRSVNGTGKVFVPNPIVALQNPNLTDQGDADGAVPAGAYDLVTLQGLDPASGGLFRLTGQFVRAIDLETPAIAPPAESTASFAYTRADDRFEWVTTYHHLDGVQRYIQALGFTDVNNRRIDVDAHGLGGADNAHYVSNGTGTGYIALGDGGVDDGEDGEVIVHEYGHSIQDNQCPNCFFGAESGAMGEGFGDALAVAYFLDASGGYQDACVADWDSTSYASGIPRCLRRVDGSKRYPGDLVGEVHDDGEIWSGMVWDLLLELSDGPAPTLAARDIVVRLLLESHFLLATDPSFLEGAQALLQADQTVFGGVHQTAIQTALAGRGLLPPPPPIFGGGSALTDCTGSFAYENPTNRLGPGSKNQECYDNDPACDSDTTVGQCTFRLAFCLGRAGHPVCVPQPSVSFQMRSPRPDATNPALATVGERLTAAVASIPGAVRGGVHRDIVSWTPFVAAGACSPEVDLVLPMKVSAAGFRKTALKLSTVAVMAGNFRDADSLRLSCLP